MLLRALTDGAVSGTGTITVENRTLGGVLISTNNTNAAVVVVRVTDSSGHRVFSISSLTPGFHVAPIRLQGPNDKQASQTLYYDISGTGASAQLFEWVE